MPTAGVLLVIVVVAAAAIAYVRSGSDDPAASAAPASAQSADSQTQRPPQKLGPHPQAVLPPLPVTGRAPARPEETVAAVYRFAAEHPEVLNYVPCYCGCERNGHGSNEDCFVASRKANGDVESWDSHGVTWAVCIDVARDAMQMHSSGASVKDIRAAVEKKWGAVFPEGHTPTPPVPDK